MVRVHPDAFFESTQSAQFGLRPTQARATKLVTGDMKKAILDTKLDWAGFFTASGNQGKLEVSFPVREKSGNLAILKNQGI